MPKKKTAEETTPAPKKMGRPRTERTSGGVIRNARFTPDEWALVEKACALTGEQPAKFMREHTIASARRVIARKGALA